MGRQFDFEDENNKTLEWMPLAVRRKMDLAGIRLSLADWQMLPVEHRRSLMDAPVATESDARRYEELVERLVGPTVVSTRRMPPVPFAARPWSTTQARDDVSRRAKSLGVALDEARWTDLDDVGRYAAYRLASPQKSEEKFVRALRELGLIGEGDT